MAKPLQQEHSKSLYFLKQGLSLCFLLVFPTPNLEFPSDAAASMPFPISYKQ